MSGNGAGTGTATFRRIPPIPRDPQAAPVGYGEVAVGWVLPTVPSRGSAATWQPTAPDLIRAFAFAATSRAEEKEQFSVRPFKCSRLQRSLLLELLLTA